MNYGSSTSSWKPWTWVTLDMIFSMRDIYINSNLNPLRNFTSSRWSTEFKGILPWNICHMITKTIPIRMRIVIRNAVKRGIPLWIWWEVNGNKATTWSEYPNGGKAIVKQILASEKRHEFKRAGLWELQSGIRVGKLTIWVRPFEITWVHQVSHCHHNR